MNDWILVLAPATIGAYFLVHPAQFLTFITWFGRLLQ
jgi:hypothetical protein